MINFKVIYIDITGNDKCPMINIDSIGTDKEDSFSYANILNMYNTELTQGTGIQVNNPKLEIPLRKMCDKIAQAVYDYKKEIKEKL